MPKYTTQPSLKPFVIRVLEMWPYMLIAISVGGFAYRALNNGR